MGKYIFWMLLMCGGFAAGAQDSLGRAVDTVRRPAAFQPVRSETARLDTSKARLSPYRFWSDTLLAVGAGRKDTLVFGHHPYFSFTDPLQYGISVREWQSKDPMFYAMLSLLILFALIRNGFHRYIQDLLKIFFRTTAKQRQLKDQLVQSPLPSLLLNGFFLLSIGMFLALLVEYYHLGASYGFWMLFAYAVLGLLAVYGTKFLTLKLLGWVFQASAAADAYIFVVFTTNKVIGMVLLPFLVVLAFTNGALAQSALMVSMILVSGLLAYRFFLSYATVSRQVRIGFFHFLLYLCAFEVAPLLLINKLLFTFLR